MDQFISNYPILFFVLTSLCPLIFWILVCLSIQKFSPWGILTKRYPLHSEFDGEWLDWQSVTVGKFFSLSRVDFNGMTSIGVSSTFLYLKIRPKFLFPFVKPIQIPWAAIQSIKETKFLWVRYCVFVVNDTPSFQIYRSRAFNNYLEQHQGESKILRDFNTSGCYLR